MKRLLLYLLIFQSLHSFGEANLLKIPDSDISIGPDSVFVEVESGHSITRYLTINNNGDETLYFEISAILHPQLKKTNKKYPESQSNKVLIFRDILAWGLDVNVPLLESFGANVTIATSPEMNSLDLSPFGLIIFESQQPLSFYNSYQANLSRFENYLLAGGNIEFHCAASSDARLPNLNFPGGVQTFKNADFDTYNYIKNANHPISSSVADTLSGNMASQEAFKNIPANADTITMNESGQPGTIVYSFGDGIILVSGMAWELAYHTNWSFSNLLPNAFQYMSGLSGTLDWLSWNPVIGTILPDSSIIIELTFDATDLAPGVYSGNLHISSRFPEKQLVTVPLMLTVTGQDPPTNLTAMLDKTNGEVVLGWDFPIKNEFEYFKIYRNDALLDSCIGTTYLDILPGAGIFNYEVRAVYAEDESIPAGPVTISWEGLPEILITPAFFDEEIDAGEILSKNLIITNDGDGELSWNTAIQNSSSDSGQIKINAQSRLMTRDNIHRIIRQNEQLKKDHKMELSLAATHFIQSQNKDIDSLVILEAHKGSSREIILACVVDGGNFGFEVWDYLNANWAEFGTTEILIDYSTLSESEITPEALLNSGANVLIIDNIWNPNEGYGALSETECAAIAQYVNDGAGLFVTGGTLNNGQFQELGFQAQYFAPLLGMNQDLNYFWNGVNATKMNMPAAAHPVFQQISNPFGISNTGTTCRPENGNWFSAITHGDILAVSEDNFTTVVGCENRIFHSSTPMLGLNTENAQFTYNVLNHCALDFAPHEWLSLSPHFGSIPPGTSDTINLNFGSEYLFPNTYTADIIINSNDTDKSLLTVPAVLKVTGKKPPTSLVAMLDDKNGTVDLSWDFQSKNDFLWFKISRNDALVDTSSTMFYLDSLPVAGTYAYKVSACYSEGESLPTNPVAISWEGKADISVFPGSIKESLGTGQNSTRQICISNTGERNLEWAIDIFKPSEKNQSQISNPDKMIDFPDQHENGQGDPDAFGYYYLDSDETGGPDYIWFDISEIGTNTMLSGDDDFVTTSLPFDFEFYGQVKDEVKISSNGYLTFGENATAYNNSYIPNADNPNDFIAPFWDDLESGETGTVHHYFDASGKRFIIQYSNWSKLNYSGLATFQVQLHQNGSIWFYYEDLDCVLHQATIGIENMDGSDGLEIVRNDHYLHDHLAIKIACTPFWLGTGELSGLITSGRSEIVNIYFDATTLTPGIYLANLIVSSNDPDEPFLTVPLSLTVGTQIIPTSLNASLDDHSGEVELTWDFQTGIDFLWFKIYRDGVLLDTSSITSYLDHLPGRGTFAYEVSVLYANGESPPAGPLEVFWRGWPDIFVEPEFLEETLGTSQTSTKQLSIINTGEGGLTWAIDIFENTERAYQKTPSCAQEWGNLSLRTGKPDPRKGNPATDGQGGPDAYGYRWIDSDVPGGPEYVWIDISEVGTNTFLTGDDESVLVDLPFDFVFYGQMKNEVRISTNGYLTFGSIGNAYDNDPIPTQSNPNDLIAPFWDDLLASDSGTNHFYYDEANSLFIIQYSNWSKLYDTGTTTFQVHLHQNGSIYFYYDDLNCALNEASIGIENSDGTSGLEIAFNADYLQEHLAVKINAIPPWIGANELSGVISSGDSQLVDINFDATDLNPGFYFADLIITSNDPDEPMITIPLSLNVTEFQIKEHILHIPPGWTGISSYLEPVNTNIEDLTNSISGQLQMIQNTMTFYQPGNNMSNLQGWNTQSGYFVKVSDSVDLVIEGSSQTNTSLNIVVGWNLIPVLSDQLINIEILLGDNLSKIEIIKDAVGVNLYWPAKSINTLTDLQAGKAYLLKANEEFILLY